MWQTGLETFSSLVWWDLYPDVQAPCLINARHCSSPANTNSMVIHGGGKHRALGVVISSSDWETDQVAMNAVKYWREPWKKMFWSAWDLRLVVMVTWCNHLRQCWSGLRLSQPKIDRLDFQFQTFLKPRFFTLSVWELGVDWWGNSLLN